MSEGWDYRRKQITRGRYNTEHVLALTPAVAISFEVVEWSEQLRPVTSVWLGAVRRSVQVRLCTSGCKSEKMFGVISPPRDLLPSIVLIKSQPSLTVFLLSSLRLS